MCVAVSNVTPVIGVDVGALGGCVGGSELDGGGSGGVVDGGGVAGGSEAGGEGSGEVVAGGGGFEPGGVVAGGDVVGGPESGGVVAGGDVVGGDEAGGDCVGGVVAVGGALLPLAAVPEPPPPPPHAASNRETRSTRLNFGVDTRGVLLVIDVAVCVADTALAGR
jgi:hypothetical protein